jgi:hypothetical protein
MLQEVEALAAQLYGSATSNEQRAEAERQLSVFSSNPEMLDQARMILEQSQQPYAQHLAATAMSKLLTANWGRFSAQQRIDMRQYVSPISEERLAFQARPALLAPPKAFHSSLRLRAVKPFVLHAVKLASNGDDAALRGVQN